MYCNSSPCSTAYWYRRRMSGVPGPANTGSWPFGSVCTWSPIASIVTGAAVPLAVGHICHAATATTAVAPAPYRSLRRVIACACRLLSLRFIPILGSSGGLVVAAPLGRANDTQARLFDLRGQQRRPERADVLVGDATCRVDDERLGESPHPVVDGDVAA